MRPDNGGTMPSKSAPFTPSSILFRPRLRDQSSEVGYRLTSDHSPLMVEAPGTAPGSDRFITTAVYRHSRLAPAPLNISPEPQSKKSMQACQWRRKAVRLPPRSADRPMPQAGAPANRL